MKKRNKMHVKVLKQKLRLEKQKKKVELLHKKAKRAGQKRDEAFDEMMKGGMAASPLGERFKDMTKERRAKEKRAKMGRKK